MNELGLGNDGFFNQASAIDEIVKKIDDEFYYVGIVQVVAVDGERVDFKPLSLIKSTSGEVLEAGVVYSVPFMRFQSSNMGLIIDPSEGDKGLVAVCDRDITTIKSTKQASTTPTRRRHSLSDSVYLGSVSGLNQPITHYIKIEKNLIEVVSEDQVVVKATSVAVEAEKVDITGETTITGNLKVTGETSVGGDFSVLGETSMSDGNGGMINFRNHVHEYISPTGVRDTEVAKNA